MGRILSHAKRPAPECSISEKSAGTDEPVKMNWPTCLRLSTMKRAASHNLGDICHSSIKRGGGLHQEELRVEILPMPSMLFAVPGH